VNEPAPKRSRRRATHSGKRSSAWVKIKASQTADLVVGGYTQGLGDRAGLGALLLGYREAARSAKLVYAGHVGAGLSGDSIAALTPQLARLHVATCPFNTPPALHRPTTWLKPQLVVEVRFLGWTASGRLRAPVFVRTRPDVAASRVVRLRAG